MLQCHNIIIVWCITMTSIHRYIHVHCHVNDICYKVIRIVQKLMKENESKSD